MFALIGAFICGAMVALQAPTNAMLTRGVGSPVNAALVSFAIGTVALLVAAFALGARPVGAAMRGLPWYAWIGGLYGALFVALAAFAAPRMGIVLFLTVAIAGQLAVGLLLDQFGAFGLPKVEIGAMRLAGVALVIIGVFLVRR